MRKITYLSLIVCFLLTLAITATVSAAPARADRGAWAPGVAYAVNDTVTYGGCTYKVLQAHTSQTGWEPPNVPALFQQLSCGGPTATFTRTNTPPGPTSTPTKTNTPGAPTPTFTRTNTPGAATPTPTRTNTPLPPTITPTRTFTPTPTSGSGRSCSGVPQYVAGTAYIAGQIVQNVGNRYSCSVAGWCSSTAAWAYAPGTGTYWTDAWTLVGPCDTGPTLTPSKTPTPCTTCGGSLPYHVITGYWQNFSNGATVLRLSSVPTAYNLIAVAFADASGSPGAVTFNIDSGLSTALGGYTNANFTSDVATVHSRGQKVIISVGGQNGTISVSDSTSAANFSNSIISLMNTFGFDGVDIDLENGINATYMAQALRTIKASFPGLIITFAPQTIDFQSTGAGYYQLAVSIKDILTINNMQYYNSGSMNGCGGTGPFSQGSVDFITAQACIQLQAGLRPDQIGLGLPASTSGAGSGYVSPSIVNNALDCLAAGTNCGSWHPTTPWPGIRGAMTWSINWDASNGYAWVNAIAAHLSAVP